jgi:hypothetical protein
MIRHIAYPQPRRPRYQFARDVATLACWALFGCAVAQVLCALVRL